MKVFLDPKLIFLDEAQFILHRHLWMLLTDSFSATRNSITACSWCDTSSTDSTARHYCNGCCCQKYLQLHT